jgi:hypothetical protein
MQDRTYLDLLLFYANGVHFSALVTPETGGLFHCALYTSCCASASVTCVCNESASSDVV